MKITIISVGKLKEKYLVEGIKEYAKRISKYSQLELIEVKDEHAPENLSQKDIDLIHLNGSKSFKLKVIKSIIKRLS